MGKDGFFSLSQLKNWLNKLLIHFNPPALIPERVTIKNSLRKNEN